MKFRIAALICFILASVVVGGAQQSDLALKTDFDNRLHLLQGAIEKASLLGSLDSIKNQIDALEIDFTGHAAFLDRAYYPETFAQKITALRNAHLATYDRVYLIQTQGVRITDLETRISTLTGQFDSLSTHRDVLFRELEESKKSSMELREAVRRLTANIAAKDRLIFSLLDSLFVTYGKDVSTMNEVQREALGQKLEHANAIQRIAEVATDNLRFLQATQLQPKDYSALIEQYSQFSNRWHGLGDKVILVVNASAQQRAGTGRGGRTKAGAPPPTLTPGAPVDSVLTLWQQKLMAGFWASLEREFLDRGVPIEHFTDPAGFSRSIRAYVDTLKATGASPAVFVNDIWKDRIDKEWREALVKDKMLGKVEFAALDRLVSELSAQKLDQRFLLYSLIVVALVLVGWWFFNKRSKGGKIEVKQQ